MTMPDLNAAVNAGAAKARRLTPVHWIVHVPDRSFAAVLLDGAGNRLDYAKCGRLSRPAAHRALRLIDAPPPYVAFFHAALDGKPARTDEAPAFVDYTSGGRE